MTGDVAGSAAGRAGPAGGRCLVGASLLLLAGILACAHPAAPADPARPYRQDGEAALAEGDAAGAVAAFQQAVRLAPTDPVALRGLLTAWIASGDGEHALEVLARLQAQGPAAVDPCPALDLAADGRLERGELAPAEDTARQAVAAGCSGAKARLARVLDARAAASRASGDLATAIGLYREAIALDPGPAVRFERLAEALLADHRVQGAVALLASGLEKHPEDRGLRDLMVRALSIR